MCMPLLSEYNQQQKGCDLHVKEILKNTILTLHWESWEIPDSLLFFPSTAEQNC